MIHDTICGFNLTPNEFEMACKKAVEERNEEPIADYVTRFDATTGEIKTVPFSVGMVAPSREKAIMESK